MMMLSGRLLSILLITIFLGVSEAWVNNNRNLGSSCLQQRQHEKQTQQTSLEATRKATNRILVSRNNEVVVAKEDSTHNSLSDSQYINKYHYNTRRTIVQNFFCSTTAFGLSLISEPSLAVTEKRRCNADDPRCGPDGTIDDTSFEVKPIPRVTNRITHVVQLTISVGERREETGYIRFGLYGDDCPASTRQMLEFLTPKGLTGIATSNSEDLIGMQSASVSLLDGGVVPNICSKTAIEFGVPSQGKAYAQSRGLMKAGDNFLPQNRPSFANIIDEPFPRNHDVAGLVSIPIKGIGYGDYPNGGSGGGDIDSAYSSAFLVTADSASPVLDKSRRVIGQIIDNDSMNFLERLANLPLQKGSGVKAVIPGVGQTKSPPLLKVIVRDIGVQKVVIK